MKPIELCRYTLRQSLCDSGDYSSFMSAEELLKNLNLKEVNQNG